MVIEMKCESKRWKIKCEISDSEEILLNNFLHGFVWYQIGMIFSFFQIPFTK